MNGLEGWNGTDRFRVSAIQQTWPEPAGTVRDSTGQCLDLSPRDFRDLRKISQCPLSYHRGFGTVSGEKAEVEIQR